MSVTFSLFACHVYGWLAKVVGHIFTCPLFYYQHRFSIIISMTQLYFLINFTLHIFHLPFLSFKFDHLKNLTVHYGCAKLKNQGKQLFWVFWILHLFICQAQSSFLTFLPFPIHFLVAILIFSYLSIIALLNTLLTFILIHVNSWHSSNLKQVFCFRPLLHLT